MRPTVHLLSEELIERIVAEARDLLCTLGVEIHNPGVLELLHGHGARIDAAAQRAFFTPDIIDRSLESAPHGFKLYDSLGQEAVDLSGDRTNYTPGSAAITILDHGADRSRRPAAADYVRYAKLMCGLPNLASQSTAFIPQDVPEKIQDSYRLYLSLGFCEKPVVTGCFTVEAFELMKDLQLAVRGSAEALAARPLTIFSCCPTAPIKWSDVTSQNVVDCARFGIPVEYISMPLSGFMAPVTMVGSLIQHTAETLSGVAISQLTRPGTPVLYGGSPAVFDVRYETTPMGDIGTMMIDCAYNEIGKSLGLPTQAYIGLSDAKLLDAQAGFESAAGALLAALSGINNCSGSGMLDFESCFSLEKLVLDNEICGSALHLLRGITPKEDFPARARFEEMLAEGHLLISAHTRRHLRQEHYLPGPVIDRANKSRWAEEGGKTLGERARAEVERLVAAHRPVRLDSGVKQQLTRLMNAAALRAGIDRLPVSI
ncbi:MAG: trimethylamine methyltransferase family protein [Deltaproteobacteria bacterium]|nr:trimethylamine methyltransferase family protein [Deltaproteobacteria bacterium]